MGIKNLPSLIQKKAGENALYQRQFSQFTGMIIAVDASLLVHQIVIGVRSSGRDLKNQKGEITSHLHGFFYKILNFLQYQITPIIVFDGKAPEIKGELLKKRRETKEVQKEKLRKIEIDSEEYVKTFQKTYTPKKADFDEIKLMLKLMGIPYINAPEEADSVCAWLSVRKNRKTGKKYVDGICSEDSDILALGGSYLFKNMTKNKKKVTVIDLRSTLREMEITRRQFVDLCILLGCDYCDKLKGVGPIKAYELIKEHENLETIMREMKQTISKSQRKCMLHAKDYFMNALTHLDHTPDFKKQVSSLKMRKYKNAELLDFLCVKHNFHAAKTITALKRLKKYYQQMHIRSKNRFREYQLLDPESRKINIDKYEQNIVFLPD